MRDLRILPALLAAALAAADPAAPPAATPAKGAAAATTKDAAAAPAPAPAAAPADKPVLPPPLKEAPASISMTYFKFKLIPDPQNKRKTIKQFQGPSFIIQGKTLVIYETKTVVGLGGSLGHGNGGLQNHATPSKNSSGTEERALAYRITAVREPGADGKSTDWSITALDDSSNKIEFTLKVGNGDATLSWMHARKPRSQAGSLKS